LTSFDDAGLAALARRVAEEFSSRGLKLVTAESCTGGYLAKLLTDIPGSSAWFECGWVCYSNAAKQRDLGVRADTLAEHGAVSEDTVIEMARGALERGEADVAIAISGVAGPDGGTAQHPVGEVWFGLTRAEGAFGIQARRERFSGDRDAIRRLSVGLALEWLLES